MSESWKKLIEKLLDSFDLDYKKEVSKYSNRVITYCFNGIYIQIDFQDSKYLNKIEVGKENRKFRSNYKIIFQKNKPDKFLVKQNCFEIDADENYELELNEMNKILVNNFLIVLLETGWREKIYKYEEEEYKAEIIIKNKTYFVSFKSDMEQDIPFLFDTFLRKIEDVFYNLNVKGKQKMITRDIKPLFMNNK